MNLIRVTKDNLEQEHICCAISSQKDIQVYSKKDWLSKQFDEGLVFLKCNVRGKCFIEYIPAENAWAPISADNYMYINCLWVSGQFKGQGLSNLLLEECIKDSKAKGKSGLVILSSKKKLGFLADPKYLRYKGFELADTCNPNFELMFMPFTKDAKKPQFNKYVESKPKQKGLYLTYTSQCPFTAKYVPLLEACAKNKNIDFKVKHIASKDDAQKCSIPFTAFTLFYDGEFITHEILSEPKFEKLLQDKNILPSHVTK